MARRAVASCASPVFVAFAEYLVCRALFTLGRYAESAAATERVLELARSSGNAVVQSSSLMNLALCTREDGSPAARQRWRATLSQLHEFRNWTNTWTVLEALAADWAARGMLEQAATIAAQLRRHGAASPSLRDRRRQLDEILAANVSEPVAAPDPAVLDRDDIVAYALSELRPDQPDDAF